MENDKDFDQPEEEFKLQSGYLEIPGYLRWPVTLISTAMIIIWAYVSIRHFYSPKIYAAPSELGLGAISLFSLMLVVAIWIPWRRLGIRVTKIGGIEFEEIFSNQATEHSEEISYLEDRIELLELHIRKADESIILTEQFSEPELRDLLIRFLKEHRKWSFSPSRIKIWGQQQKGYSELSSYEVPFIRSILQKLVSERELETRISKKGNTLYRIADQ